jgi:uncharacterized protein with PQ loop repeat
MMTLDTPLTKSESVNDAFSVFFLIGMIVIYAPQFLKFRASQSSYGYSPWFFFLGHLAAMLSCINGVIAYLPVWHKCTDRWECSERLFGLALIFTQWLFFLANFALYLYYFMTREQWLASNSENRMILVNDESTDLVSTRGRAGALLNLSFLLAVIAVVVSIFHYDSLAWSESLSLITTVLFCLHYLPQIVETLRLGTIGSVSLITLILTCLGTFIWAYFLAFVAGAGSKTASKTAALWVPYVVVGIMQLCLIVIGVSQELRRRQFRLADMLYMV